MSFTSLVATFLLSMLALRAWPAEIEARVSRTQVAAQESFQLIFEVAGDPGGPPELSVLQPDFDIIGRSESRNVRTVGGQVRRDASLILTLVPKTTGRLVIPAVNFGKDWSNPVAVQVSPYEQAPGFEADDDLYFEVNVAPEEVYVQEQILFTVRLFLGGDVAGMYLGEPEIGDPEAIVRRLGETRYETRREGRSYSVLERRYAVFPALSGRLTLGPVTFHGRAGARGPLESSDLRAPLQGPKGIGEVKRVRSEVARLEVKPAPGGEKFLPWLPARGLQLIESWPSGLRELSVGQPLIRRVTLMADGLTAEQLPPVPFDVSVGFERYPEQPFLKDQTSPLGVTGSRQERITLIPARPGIYTLPGIEIEWWNSAANDLQAARLPPRVVKVIGAAETDAPGLPAGAAREPAASVFPPFPGRETRGLSEAPPGRDWSELPSVSDEQPQEADEHEAGYGVYWPWIALLLAFGWFFALAAWWVGRRRPPPGAAVLAPPKETPTSARKPKPKSVVETAIEAVQKAYQDRDAEAAKAALLRWGKIVWRDQPPSNLSALAQRCPAAVGKEILDLDRALYSPEPERWYERPLWKQLSQVSERAAVEGW